jgi:hypothetical protein
MGSRAGHRRFAAALAALALAPAVVIMLRPADASAAPAWPKLKAGSSFEWQLVAPWQTHAEADVYDIDLLEAVPSAHRVHVAGFGSYTVPRGENAGAIARLHRKDREVVCYFDTGAWESYWPDAKLFPRSVRGRNTGWQGERWLDIRQGSWHRFAPLIWARIKLARSLGCNAVEGDQNNGAENRNGFGLGKQAMVRWYRQVFRHTHRAGMAALQKNGLSRVNDLLRTPGRRRLLEPDGLLIEECAQFHECGRLGGWSRTAKAVFEVEYTNGVSVRRFDGDVCRKAAAAGRFAILKREPPSGDYRRTCQASRGGE